MMLKNGSKSTQAPRSRQGASTNPTAVATLSGHTDGVNALTWLSNGLLASGSSDHTIKLWNVESGNWEKTLSRFYYVHSPSAISWSVNVLTQLTNGWLASGSDDKTISLWDVESGECEKDLRGTGMVTALTQLTNGYLASGSRYEWGAGCFDYKIKLWNVESGACEKTLSKRGEHTASVVALTELSNGWLASGSYDKTINLWNVESEACEKTLSGHKAGVNALTLLPNGWLASGSYDKTIKLWDVESGACVKTLSGHTESVTALTPLTNGSLASGSDDKTIKLWNVESGKCKKTLSGHTNVVIALTQLTNGWLVSGSRDKTIKCWDLGFPPMLLQQEKANLCVEAPPVEQTNDDVVQKETPPKSTVTATISSESSEPDLREISNLSLSQSAGTIPFSELELGEELGRGGFGVVCKALWQCATPVAVKQLLGRLTPDLVEEFQRETSVHARLHHPNIIALYGICVESMKYAMVMEFMASGSLYDVLKNPAELPWSLRLTMALDLVSGLLYLHGQHIIHRDLKSLNILIDDRMRAKVSDFGLAKIKLTSASMTKGGAGTPHWMAPELFDETANSPETDVYATGVVFWEIAARKLPYEGKNPSQLMRFVEKGNRELIPAGTPASFAALITRCWSQRAEERPSMTDVAKEMREIHKSETLAAGGRPGSALARAKVIDSGYAAFSLSK